MVKLKIIVLLTFLSVLIYWAKAVYAHPGNTASDGCHYCWTNCDRWGEVYGERHCHNGGGFVPVPVVNYTFPKMDASWTWQPNPDGESFEISVDLQDPNPTNYSVTLNKCAGCNPGPLTDFVTNKFTFHNIKAGTWYMNVKKSIGNYWSTTAYWTVKVPDWYPPPAPTAIPEPTEALSQSMSQTLANTPLLTYIGLGTAGYLGYKLIKKKDNG